MVSLTRFQRIGYASGAFAKGIQWNVTDFVLLYYMAEIQGLGAKHAGIILLVSLVWSGILDILLAILFDKKHSNFQKVIGWSSPFCVLTFALLFIPIYADMEWLLLYYFVTTLLFRVGYSLVDIPHNAMLATITQDSHERTQLSGYRIFFNSCAVLLFACFVGQLLVLLESGNQASIYLLVTGTCGVLLINLLFSVAPFWSMPNAHSYTSPSLKLALLALIKNRPFMILIAFSLLAETLMSVFYRSSVYIASLVLGNEELTTGLIIGLALGKILAMPLFMHLAKFVEKRQIIIITCLGKGACLALFYLLAPTTIMPASVIFFLSGVFAGGLHMIVWAALPDTIEYGKHYYGIANQALTFGVFHLFMRISGGISFGIISAILLNIDYERGPSTVIANDLAFYTTLIAGIGALLGVIIARFYSLSHASHSALAISVSASAEKR